jgi:hypothetical protein
MCCPIMAPAIENVVSLDDLLADYDLCFRAAVCRALAEQGYELGSELPNLQLARELQASLGAFLEAQGFEPELTLLQRFLDWAEREGVLVDLSPAAEA